jgi:Domain of unknown function (DUF1876)
MSRVYMTATTVNLFNDYELKAPRFTVHIDPTETFTTVVLVGDRYFGIGTAKRNPRDKHDPQVGVDIALARAYREVADRLEKGVSVKW